MAQRSNLKNIRTLLTEGFTDEELRRLCYDNSQFRSVFEQLSQEMGKDRVIDKLIQYAERKELIGSLLAVAKEINPIRYEKHQPYTDVIIGPTTSSGSHGKPQGAINLCLELSQKIKNRVFSYTDELIKDFDRLESKVAELVNSDTHLASLVTQYHQIECINDAGIGLGITNQIKSEQRRLLSLQARRKTFGIEAPLNITKEIRTAKVHVKLLQLTRELLNFKPLG